MTCLKPAPGKDIAGIGATEFLSNGAQDSVYWILSVVTRSSVSDSEH